MIYDHTNAAGVLVHDMDAGEQIRRVMAINPQAGWVLVAELPVRATAYGHVASRRIRFRSIHFIQGDEQAFHCYGRLS